MNRIHLPDGTIKEVALDDPALILDGSLEATTPPPPPPPPGTIVFPSGAIKTKALRGRNFGIDWSTLARWEPFFTQAGKKYGVAPILMVPIAVIEAGGQHYTTGKTTGTKSEVITRGSDSLDSVPAIGMMQVKCGYHSNTPACWTPDGNIDVSTRLMASFMRELGSWERAIQERYHPADDPGSGWTRAEYVRAMREMILEIKAVQPQPDPVPGPDPGAPPVIYDLTRDYARFGLDPNERDYVLQSRIDNRNGYDPECIVWHIQDGITSGSLDWWVHGYVNGQKVRASVSRMIQRDGSVLIVIPDKHGPWTNGYVCSPTSASAHILALSADPNAVTLAIEFEGRPGVPLTDPQLAAGVWQTKDWLRLYPKIAYPKDVIGHFTIDNCTRSNCPSPVIYEQLHAAMRV